MPSASSSSSPASPSPAAVPVSVVAQPGLASILIPCCGQLEYTRLCLPSILKHTRSPYELVFLDIGSLDGTAEFLAGFAVNAQVRVEIVRTPTDVGIAQAVQDAARLARGEYLVLLNNDTVVTDAWLAQMIALAKSSASIGLVGPMSNYAAPPQLVETIPYRLGPHKTPQGGLADWHLDTAPVDAFARQWRDEHRGQWLHVERLGGFCLLFKREVLKRVGHLREPTDLGLFDTDILGLQARQVGYTLALCKDLFVHHFGTRTFAHGAPLDIDPHTKPRD